MKGAICFLVLFSLIAPKSRMLLSTWVADAGNWVIAWAPFSFIILMLVLVAPVVSAMLMFRWPKTPEPENPLAKYKESYKDVVAD